MSGPTRSHLSQDSEDGRLRRSALPPQPLLGRETDAAGFQQILRRRDEFKDYPDIEDLAAAVHFNFLQSAKRSELEAQAKKDRGVAWAIDPSIKQAYADLTADAKAASRAAARRVPDHLALIGFTVQAQQPGDRGTWKASLAEAIGTHIDRLAQAEHIAWCAERIANGWTYAKDRDNKAKHHHLLVDWAELSPADQEKDRAFVRTIPQLLEIAGFKAVPVEAPR